MLYRSTAALALALLAGALPIQALDNCNSKYCALGTFTPNGIVSGTSGTTCATQYPADTDPGQLGCTVLQAQIQASGCCDMTGVTGNGQPCDGRCPGGEADFKPTLVIGLNGETCDASFPLSNFQSGMACASLQGSVEDSGCCTTSDNVCIEESLKLGKCFQTNGCEQKCQDVITDSTPAEGNCPDNAAEAKKQLTGCCPECPADISSVAECQCKNSNGGGNSGAISIHGAFSLILTAGAVWLANVV